MNHPTLATHPPSRRAARGTTTLLGFVLVAVLLAPFTACQGTRDPRSGRRGNSESTSNGASTSNANNGGRSGESSSEAGSSAEGGALTDGGVPVGGEAAEGGNTSNGGNGSGGSENGGEHSEGGSNPGSGGDDNTAGTGGQPTAGLDCGEPPAAAGSFTKKLLLQSAAQCATRLTCLLSNAVTVLEQKVEAYVESPSGASLTSARDAWKEAMEAWSLLTPFHFGPIASVGEDQYHGRGVGAFIHAWPAAHRCEVEKQVVLKDYREMGFQRILPGARGLSALEYLLFYEGSDTVCASNSSAAKAWVLLSAAEIADAKRDYAAAVIADVRGKADELVNVWDAAGENFSAKLLSAEGYGTEQETLTVVSWSLLYLYEAVRDRKVAPYTGLVTTPPNPESPYAQTDLENIRNNVKAFRSLFQGCGTGYAGLGVEDWLLEAGAMDLRADILSAVDQIEATANALPPLHEASTSQIDAFHTDLKVLSDLLKGQLFGSGSVLNLKLPASAASDTD